MSITLSNLRAHPHKSRKRIGRGTGSGHGTFSTRGQKGQRSRTGGRKNLKRRGLKLYLAQIPKRKGFKSLSIRPAVVNIADLEKKFESGSMVNLQTLRRANLVGLDQHTVKILGTGKLTKKLTVQVHGFSKSAKDAITKVGGNTQLIS
jgi:large subunit ribosomal protein L15